MKIEAGMLREVIAIQARTDTDDTYGGVVGAWSDVTGKSSVRAMVKPINQHESLMGAQIEGTVTHAVVLRYDADITRNHRVAWGSRTLNISRVNTWDVKNRWMTLECAEDV